MKGPYRLDKSRNRWCGRGWRSWCRFPIRGSFHGPGGSFEGFLVVLIRVMRRMMRNGVRRVGMEKVGRRCSMREMSVWYVYGSGI